MKMLMALVFEVFDTEARFLKNVIFHFFPTFFQQNKINYDRIDEMRILPKFIMDGVNSMALMRSDVTVKSVMAISTS